MGTKPPASGRSYARQSAGRDEAQGGLCCPVLGGQPQGLPIFGLPVGATARGGLAWRLCLLDGPSWPVSSGPRAGPNPARPRLLSRPPPTATSSHPTTGHSPNIWLVFPASWGGGRPGARRSLSAGTVWESPLGLWEPECPEAEPSPGAEGVEEVARGRWAGPPHQGARAAKSLPQDHWATLDPRPSVRGQVTKGSEPRPDPTYHQGPTQSVGAYSCHSTPPSLSFLFCQVGSPRCCPPLRRGGWGDRAWGPGPALLCPLPPSAWRGRRSPRL